MQLKNLLKQVSVLPEVNPHPALNQEIKGLATNSHACQPGDLFLGMPGTRVDGGDFWPSAIASGAIAAFVSEAAFQKNSPTPTAEAEQPCVISSTDMNQTCAEVAAAFYGYPTQKMQMVGSASSPPPSNIRIFSPS